MGIIVRGMDLAIASGVMGAEAIKAAKKRSNYSAESLAAYKTMLDNSFVLKDLHTFRNVWKVLNNQRLFMKYPNLLSRLLMDLMSIGAEPKPKLSSTALKHFRKNFLNLSALKDALNLLKI
jgi:electron transfer flavoprotein-quinone oxidoreductase